MKVFAAEHCPCIYESLFGVISLHTTREEADVAMWGHEVNAQAEEMEFMGEDWTPCEDEAWRVTEYEINAEGNSHD